MRTLLEQMLAKHTTKSIGGNAIKKPITESFEVDFASKLSVTTSDLSAVTN